ncbi:MAG TPA: helix-turn-helix transcriptional regulator [Mucilaginibacter sp.]|jgi:transcriptional regulator with XRE-family HTH domain|nr:helix-turn-helix transcriptional regulator [Mucilaginibacter sp.]
MNVDAQLQAVAANVKKRRNELRISQMQVAQMLKITQNAYSKIEMAKTKMSVERLYEIADILKIPASDLMTVNVMTMHPTKKAS